MVRVQAGEYVQDPSSAVWANAQLSMSVSGGPNGLDQVDLQPGNFQIIEGLIVELTLQGVQSVGLFAQLASDIYSIAGPGAYTAFQFGNSAQLSLTVPESVAVVSGSGVFLVDAPPIPVPAALPLFASALGFLGYAARARRR